MLFKCVLLIVIFLVVTATQYKINVCACGKICNYDVHGGKRTHCGSCKTLDMIYLKKRKCICGNSQPKYTREGERASHCKACKTSGMVDVVSIRY